MKITNLMVVVAMALWAPVAGNSQKSLQSQAKSSNIQRQNQIPLVPDAIQSVPTPADQQDADFMPLETQVYSLAEAGIVFGFDSASTADIARPRIMPLPPEARTRAGQADSVTVIAPLEAAPHVLGVPTGAPAGEVGKTRSYRLEPERKLR